MANPFGEDISKKKNYGGVTDTNNDFHRLQQKINTSCCDISRQTNQLRQLSKQIGTPQDDQDLRNEINELRRSAFSEVEETAGLMKDVLQAHSRHPTRDRSKEIAVAKLRQTFDKIAREFATVYEDMVNKLHANPRPVISTSMKMVDDDQMNYENHETAELIQNEQNALFAENRAQQIELLRDDITQLHEVMVSVLKEQQEGIDYIEANVERARASVMEGNKGLQAAVRYKRCSSSCKLIAIITVIVLMIVLTVVLMSVILACTLGTSCHRK